MELLIWEQQIVLPWSHMSVVQPCSLAHLGCTWEFSSMVGYIKRMYPQTQLIVVGFSLGGNIVCKFLGENMVNQERVLCCVSICQGYSALRWVVLSWQD